MTRALHPDQTSLGQENSPPDNIRLHITPFTAELLPVYLPASVRSKAIDISFHTIETFPDKGFGFVTLPAMEAGKLRKKLQGSIVKGSKVRVEEARPEGRLKRKTDDVEEVDEISETKESKRAHKKEKKKEEKSSKEVVLEGFELPDDRKIKRGWTEPEIKKRKKGEKKTEKSKYSKESELLFRAKLPKNMTEVTEEVEKDEKKEKRKKDKSKKKSSREIVVHEFEHTNKTPTFIKKQEEEGLRKSAYEYIEGQGWVDEDGNVVDDTKPRKLMDEKIDSALQITSKKGKGKKKDKKSKKDEDETNMSTGDPMHDVDENRPSNDANELEPEAPKEPHPLETLFKRPPPVDAQSQPKPESTNPTFSFFEQGEIEEGEEDAMEEEEVKFGKFNKPNKIEIPSTPFEKRQTRSGAPTPDTAAAFKRFSFSRGTIGIDEKLSEESEDDLDDQDEMDVDDPDQDNDGDEGVEDSKTSNKEGSAFTKWFWENRGDNNRAWKKRRKEAMKEKRRRENRRIGRRVV